MSPTKFKMGIAVWLGIALLGASPAAADDNPDPSQKEKAIEKTVAQLKPLVERLSALSAELSKGKRTNEEIVDTLFAATLTRLPKESEQATAVKRLQDAKDRTVACRDIVWSLLNSKEFLKMHDLDKDIAASLHAINSLSEVLDAKPGPEKQDSKKPDSK